MRLDLDFKLDTLEERIEYLNKYINNNKDFTEANLEMMANYILWKVEDPDFEVDSNNSPWKNRESKHISWQALQEEELEGNRKSVYFQISEVQEKGKKRKLIREEILKKLNFPDCTEKIHYILENPNDELPVHDFTLTEQKIAWFTLWGQIDKTEYTVQTWELLNGKRRADLPIRQELFERLAFFAYLFHPFDTFQKLIDDLNKTAQSWDGYTALKKKRQLVALRTEQYSLLDALQGEALQKHGNIGLYWTEPNSGLNGFKPFMAKELIFRDFNEKQFSPKYQELCIKQLQYADAPLGPKEIDFRDPKTVRNLLAIKDELSTALESESYQDYEVTSNLLKYLDFYIDQCHFSPDLYYILMAKMSGIPNRQISEHLKKNFNLSYKENYISTIFTKRIINAIVKEVEKHYRDVERILMGRNVFKICSCCGKLLPRSPEYFNRRATSNDGFFNYCKNCKNKKKTIKGEK